MPLADKPTLLIVAVALVDRDGRILLSQRPEGKFLAGMWEFPGGKIKPGETPEYALIRETQEELGGDTATSCLAPVSFASHEYADYHLVLLLDICRRWLNNPVAREKQPLAWAKPADLRKYQIPPANREFIYVLKELWGHLRPYKGESQKKMVLVKAI